MLGFSLVSYRLVLNRSGSRLHSSLNAPHCARPDGWVGFGWFGVGMNLYNKNLRYSALFCLFLRKSARTPYRSIQLPYLPSLRVAACWLVSLHCDGHSILLVYMLRHLRSHAEDVTVVQQSPSPGKIYPVACWL